MGSDRKYIHCSREEEAGGLPIESNALTYAHIAKGPCRCGKTHVQADALPARSSGEARRYGPSRDVIEATYDYIDASGDLLFQVVRKTGKRFLQRTPDGAGGWEWKSAAAKRVLYRLPAILAADASETVYVVEGEKDADTLAKHDLLATTSPNGAGKWGAVAKHAQEVLRARHVVVLPDADEPGRKHGADVLKSLRPVAASVVVVELPGAKDAAEWLGKGGTKEELARLVAEARKAPTKVSAKANEDAAVKGDWTFALLRKKSEDGSDKAALRDAKGAGIANAVTILTNDPAWKGVIAYDEFAEAVVTRSAPRWRLQDARDCKAGEWSENDTSRLQSWLADKYAIDLGPDSVIAAVKLVADTARIHPVRDWLESLKWDGQRRCASWLVDVFACDDTVLTRAVGTAWLVSAVARIYRPGCQVDTVLVLEGEPGIFKSSVLRELVGDPWFFEMSITDVTKLDAMQVLRNKWIAEFPEIDSLSKVEQGHVKGYFSRRVDRYRASYGRTACDFPRQCVFAATTNKDQWIVDETGGTGRRMWPVWCRQGDVARTRVLREQLWAEAVDRYRSGEAWHMLDPELRDSERAQQDERYRSDPWEQQISRWLSAPVDAPFPSRADHGVTTLDVLRGALAVDVAKITVPDAMRVAAVLRRLGWSAGRRELRDGARVRPYRPRACPPESDADVVASIGNGHDPDAGDPDVGNEYERPDEPHAFSDLL